MSVGILRLWHWHSPFEKMKNTFRNESHTKEKESVKMNKDMDSLPESKKVFADLPAKEKPDMVDSDNISLFDLHEDMQTVDSIPVEELNKRVKAEDDELLAEVFRKESPDEKRHN